MGVECVCVSEGGASGTCGYRRNIGREWKGDVFVYMHLYVKGKTEEDLQICEKRFEIVTGGS